MNTQDGADATNTALTWTKNQLGSTHCTLALV